MKTCALVLTALILFSATSHFFGQSRRPGMQINAVSKQPDVPYCTNNGAVLKLDLYFPKRATNDVSPVAVFIHGGGWEHGNKTGGGWLASIGNELLHRGYVVASVDYRLAPEHKWPAFIHDAKTSIRFLRANAQKYQLDSNHIGTWGTSAGGHLVAMLGTSDATANLEGEHYLDQSSRVQAVVDFFGPSDLRGMMKSTQHIERGQRVFGNDAAVQEASPVIYVSRDDPPFLIIHGEDDTLVPVQQGKILFNRLKETGVPAELIVVKNGTHGLAGRDLSPGPQELVKTVADFFDEHLRTTKK